LKQKKNFLVFCGNPGIGKTHFCSAMVEWAMENFQSFRYFNEAQLLQKLRESMEGSKGDYLSCLDTLIDDPLIILDDIGSQGVNEWRQEVIFDAIDKRYNSMLPTVITSNFTRRDFESKYNGRVASRLFATENTIIELHNEKDRRQEGV
jgi:DNA replication protein DnaC